MNRETFLHSLKSILAEQPGKQGRRRFLPELNYGRYNGPPTADSRPAAVLMLLYFRQQWRLPLTMRQPHLSAHAGQISLPGGVVDSGETTRQAAVREAEEELGVRAADIRLLGTLSPLYLYNSNFRVTPWVGYLRRQTTFRINPSEVASWFDLPLRVLCDPCCHGTMPIQRGPLQFDAPYIRCQEHRIWGATAIMLGELAEALQRMHQLA